jgi:hypothetical protein
VPVGLTLMTRQSTLSRSRLSSGAPNRVI